MVMKILIMYLQSSKLTQRIPGIPHKGVKRLLLDCQILSVNLGNYHVTKKAPDSWSPLLPSFQL
ncbi:hypothetical protein R1sor_020570 [Riccia sorocarpa]|uniref:Uncharacterized protein n=1 Tax=Riccia sorocarpa TaxID=122646 RepID=A0ABD3IFP5_9MARC